LSKVRIDCSSFKTGTTTLIFIVRFRKPASPDHIIDQKR
jgi:hypothetical protein